MPASSTSPSRPNSKARRNECRRGPHPVLLTSNRAAERPEVPILVGEKLTGKIGRFDVGVLDVQTGDLTIADRQIAPSKNLAVARVKANF